MSRNRFELLLRNFHLSDNESSETNLPKLYKIQVLIDKLNSTFQNAYTPHENVCIDETMIPYRGRLGFRQYIPGKRHKYGLKLFKLCLQGGYTWNVKLYAGKENSTSGKLSTNVVMELMAPLLNSGRTLVTDNFYTSVELAHQLNEKETHLIGTLNKKRKYNPQPIVSAKLSRGEMVTLQSDKNCIVGKWKDKRDVLFLTTKAVPVLTEVPSRRGPIKKPSTILEYNTVKSYIDVSDQLASYATTVRKGVKWYRKVAIELLTNTAVVNAHALYKIITNNSKVQITEFREKLATSMIFGEAIQTGNNSPRNPNVRKHELLEPEERKRGRCTLCYTKLTERYGRATAAKQAKQVYTMCGGCPGINFMCLACFYDKHTSTLKN
ncbi:hypothetical protein J6590_108268 [Homalodisca vitripennis]|nr:hypothetical protein J6590_108268 [Homalodisca vitripennis]